MATFKIKRTRHKQYRVTIVADNGETLFTSETYTRKAKAKEAIDIVVNDLSAGGWSTEDET